MNIAVLPGDGVGKEVVAEAVRVLEALDQRFEFEFADVGGAAYEVHGHPLPQPTLKLARSADAVLFGAVGDPKYDALERHLRPEQAILGLRKRAAAVRQLSSGDLLPRIDGCFKPKAGSGVRFGSIDRARADRGHLFRSAQRPA